MTQRPTTLERAFEIARAGQTTSISELRRQLSREGYSDARPQTDGASIMRQLSELMRRAQGGAGDPAVEAKPPRAAAR